MNAKDSLLILPIIGVMISAVAIYFYDMLEKSGYSLDEFMVEQVQNFKSDLSGSYYDNATSHVEDETSYQSNFNGSKIAINVGYDCLDTDSEKICYKLILRNVEKISSETNSKGLYGIEPVILPDQVLDSNQIKKVIYAVQNDRPDIFWLSSYFSYSSSQRGTTIKLGSNFSKKDMVDATNKLWNKIAEILNKVPESATDYEKELFIHDYLVENCAYTRRQNHGPQVYTAYGCLVNGQAVCEGYSRATQILMCALGIECRTISGTRNTESHMWNIVRLGNEWYHLDVTWDDQEAIKKYNYFNVTDDIIQKDHKIAVSMSDDPQNYYKEKCYNFTIPKCKSLKENFFNKNSVKISNSVNLTDDTIPKKLASLKASQKNVLYIQISENLGFERAKNILFANNSKTLFNHIKAANNSSANGKPFDMHQFEYSECKAQNVLAIQLF